VVTAVAVSRRGDLVAIGQSDGSVDLWSPERDEVQRLPNGPGDQVNALAFTPDGETLIAGSHDQTVRLWHLDPPASAVSLGTPTATPLAILRDHHNVVNAVVVSADGRLLASAGNDGMIVLQAPTPVLADHACDLVWRDLDRDEWLHFVGSSLPYARPCPNRPVLTYPLGL
jgi:WD40 repeat protein